MKVSDLDQQHYLSNFLGQRPLSLPRFMKIHNVLLAHKHMGVKTLCLWHRWKWKNRADRN